MIWQVPRGLSYSLLLGNLLRQRVADRRDFPRDVHVDRSRASDCSESGRGEHREPNGPKGCRVNENCLAARAAFRVRPQRCAWRKSRRTIDAID